MISHIAAPGPRSFLPGGQMLDFRRNPLEFMTRMKRRYGDVVRFRIGPQRAYLVSDPDLIRQVLVTQADAFIKGTALQKSKKLLGEGLLTSENPLHKRQRRLAQPAFHRARINAYGEMMVRRAVAMRERWTDESEIDVAQEMSRLTLAVVAETLFCADVESEADEIGAAITDILKLFPLLLLPYSELLDYLPLPCGRRFEAARAQLDKIIYRMIDEHRSNLAQGIDNGDLLSMLLAAQDEEADQKDEAHGMTDRQVRDEAMTIFLAGHETVANALAWTWYFLAQHTEVEAKLHKEIDDVLGKRNAPSPKDFPNLRYTEMVIAEAMRLRPPAWTLGRLAVRDVELGRYLIPARSLVLTSQFVVHRDERFFPDSQRFDPERWTSEARAARPQFSYFPFGGGARRCIGESFAWMESVLLLATLAHEWRVRLLPGQRIEMQPLITLRPKHGVAAKVERQRRYGD